MTFFMEAPLSEMADAALFAHQRFWELAGDELTQYASETMRKHRKLNRRSRSIVPSWFSPAAPSTDSHGVEFTDATPFNAAPNRLLAMSGREETAVGRAGLSTVVRLSLPAEWGQERATEMFALFRELAEHLPYRSGQAGYVLECSRYFRRPAMDEAWSLAMRYPGLDIHSNIDKAAVKFDGVRGIGWLTLLDQRHLDTAGSLPPSCPVTPIAGGSIIATGPSPELGDVNRGEHLPVYQDLFAALEPLTAATFERSPWLPVSSDHEERTQRFYRRYARA
jgi:hypothetical protein